MYICWLLVLLLYSGYLLYPKLWNMSETCLTSIQHQIPVVIICVQNSIGSLVLYNRLNSIKSSWLFGFICVKIHGHFYLFPLPNYLLQTPQNYSNLVINQGSSLFNFADFMQSFLLSDLNSYLVFYYWNICLEICFNYFFYYFMYLRLVITL